VAILVGRRKGIKGGEREKSRSRVNHGLLSSPTVGVLVGCIVVCKLGLCVMWIRGWTLLGWVLRFHHATERECLSEDGCKDG
jgi:hypothetical protein